MCLNLNQPALTFNQVVESGILELGNTTENYNYSGAECPNNFWFRKFCIFFQNYQNQGQSTRKERNDEKKIFSVSILSKL